MPLVTLCVTHRWSDAGCIPTQSVTAIKLRGLHIWSKTALAVLKHNN
jgi:hypothetical protein